MSNLTKHTLTVNISDRIEWINKRCGLTEIQKDYVTAQMKEAVSDAVNQTNGTKKQINISFSSESELRAYVELHMSIAIRPVRKSKTKFIYPFSSFNARNQIVENMVECLMNKK